MSCPRGRRWSMATTTGASAGAERGVAALRPEDARQRRFLTFYACAFLLVLAFPLLEAWSRGGWSRVVGVAAVAAFCATYAWGYVSERVSWQGRRGWRQWSVWGWLAALVALTLVLVVVAGPSAASGLAFVACGGAVTAPTRLGLAVVAAAGVSTGVLLLVLGVPPLVSWAIGGWIVLVGLMVWGATEAGRRHEGIVEIREQRAELAVGRERTRLARDLHDILGHSLTVITVKAELAGRLVDADPERAKAELADLERLSRDALADIRTTVSNYRQLSLPAELARGARALESAGIEARFPSAADDVPTALRDPFAWVVREGVTNVIRHSGARTCTVTLTRTSVEVRDDGRPANDVLVGNGLTGLRERTRQAGLRIVTERAHPHGFVLRAEEDA